MIIINSEYRLPLMSRAIEIGGETNGHAAKVLHFQPTKYDFGGALWLLWQIEKGVTPTWLALKGPTRAVPFLATGFSAHAIWAWVQIQIVPPVNIHPSSHYNSF